MIHNIIDDWTEPGRLWIENSYNELFLKRYFNSNHQQAHLFLTFLVTFGVYWTVGIFYTFIDIFERPKFLLRYKVQHNKSQVNRKTLIKLLKRVFAHQFMAIFLAYILMKFNANKTTRSTRIPTLSRLILEWIVFFLTREAAFYYSHRLIHHPLLYKHIHKTHHEWQTPIAISASYSHPIEHIVSGLFPIVIGPELMSSHYLVEFIWSSYCAILTLNNHSGWHFPLTFSPLLHDFHHLKFDGNYGILGFLDWLHGTDRLFRKSKYFQNHRIYFSLTPPASYDKME